MHEVSWNYCFDKFGDDPSFFSEYQLTALNCADGALCQLTLKSLN